MVAKSVTITTAAIILETAFSVFVPPVLRVIQNGVLLNLLHKFYLIYISKIFFIHWHSRRTRNLHAQRLRIF